MRVGHTAVSLNISALGASEKVLKKELQKRGYARHPALKKPPLSEVKKQKRLVWAEAHKDWNLDDWMTILWSDESHPCEATAAEFQERCITQIEWPPYSPDLNPIKNAWDSMKNYIQFYPSRLYGEKEIRHDEFRKIVKAARDDATKPERLEELIKSMPRRCEAVIRANGGPTKY
ncbi:unnamed protein product [Trifolium pratense]|uniref:Uncharacterized protein n=1 Tax=Trifolium pratense TaxID=57577 RepID=A0ACB0KY12_TRIPR|nr:unnamed protein product [Trifolium pratense]